MNKQLRFAGLVLILGLALGFGYWQQHGLAAGRAVDGLKQLFFPAAASKKSSPTPRRAPVELLSTITVTSLADGAVNAANCPGANCRLRDAIAKAVNGDTINFSVTGTITLNSGQLDILKDLTINGPGPAQLTISGNGASRVFFIRDKTVALSGMTIANGNPGADRAGEGCGIYNAGANLTLTNCTLSGNSSLIGTGGGIFNNNGAVTIINCTLSGNSSDDAGGGLHNYGTAVLTNCTLSGNSTTGRGGGILSSGGSLTITNCTLSGNSAADKGGGLYMSGGTVSIRNTLIAGNTAANIGQDVGGLSIQSLGYNLVGIYDVAGLHLTTGDQVGTPRSPLDPLLALLHSAALPSAQQKNSYLLVFSTMHDAFINESGKVQWNLPSIR